MLLTSVHADCPCICWIIDVTLCTVFPGALTCAGSIVASIGHGAAEAGSISFMPGAVRRCCLMSSKEVYAFNIQITLNYIKLMKSHLFEKVKTTPWLIWKMKTWLVES